MPLDAQRYFLTYSQAANILPESVADQLYQLSPTPTFVEVGTEHHRDGGIHYHAVVVFPRRIQRGTDFFDILRYPDGLCHPNILAIRNGRKDLYNRRHYIRKGDRLDADTHKPKSHADRACDYDHEPLLRGSAPPYVEETRSIGWGGILELAQTEDEFYSLVQTHHPSDWVLRHSAVESFAKKFYHRVPPFAPGDSMGVADSIPEIDQWVLDVKNKVGCVPWEVSSRHSPFSLLSCVPNEL